MTPASFIERIADESASPILVAELSGNHGGELDQALALVDAAAESGADAVKLQTYRPELITIEAREERFLIKDGLWAGRYLHDLYAEAMTPWEWHPALAERAAERGLFLFSSPFDETAVDFLEESIDPPLYKIASFELNHLPLLRTVARTGKPVAASVGASTRGEIGTAVEVLRGEGSPCVVLLQCVSEYPADPKDFNLSSIPRLAEAFGVATGLSDHSPGHLAAVAATALGARLIEKHLVMDRDDGSIDAGFSMTPSDFKELTDAVRLAHEAVGQPVLGVEPNAAGRRFRRSILVAKPISQGDVFTADNLRVARPGDGLDPASWEEVLGQTAAGDLPVGHPLGEGDWV
ncbi:MAG: pseudaminic acid synthase [Opitutales bacterium]|nr:pseudaminic acid synthase [Opitutales bacterium]